MDSIARFNDKPVIDRDTGEKLQCRLSFISIHVTDSSPLNDSEQKGRRTVTSKMGRPEFIRKLSTITLHDPSCSSRMDKRQLKRAVDYVHNRELQARNLEMLRYSQHCTIDLKII